MSDPDPQECNCFDGTLLYTELVGQCFLDFKGESIESRWMSIEILT